MIKFKNNLSYHDWIKKHNYSILSPRHRGMYAEMVFRKYCLINKIFSQKINPKIDILAQIDADFLKKIQQKELKNLGKIPFNWFSMELGQGYFVEVKMGTSNMTKEQRNIKFQRNKLYLFRVFEDGEIVIKKD